MEPEIKKILYATDLSKNSSYAFLYALDLAKKYRANIIILHAVEPIPEFALSYVAMVGESREKRHEELVEKIKGSLQNFCKKAEAEIGAPCLDLISKVLVPVGYPPNEILNVAEEENCDLIVMGSHGKGFLAHTFLGSVSSAVLNRTKKPVFIVPLPEKVKIEWDGI
ncbi:MAG: universal stress protein [Desulfobacterota bacterium]|nr:universal stress protein [Thermodesulfobacteriota bacterium]